MTTKQTTNQDNTGLPVQYESAPTFMPACISQVNEPSAVAAIVAEERADLSTLANWITCANEADVRRGHAAEILRAAGRVHLAWCCIMGACVQHVYTIAAADGESIKSLFKDCHDRRSKIARAAGGACFNFTYASGNKYRQLYLGIHARMIAEGGMSPELLQQSINDHVRAFMAGVWGDSESLAFFGPFLSADSLRAELATLFPREPKKPQTAAEAVEESLAGLPASYDNRRAKMATEWSGYLETMDTFIEAYIPLSTPSEREAKAAAFDNMARRLREANKPQPLGF